MENPEYKPTPKVHNHQIHLVQTRRLVCGQSFLSVILGFWVKSGSFNPCKFFLCHRRQAETGADHLLLLLCKANKAEAPS